MPTGQVRVGLPKVASTHLVYRRMTPHFRASFLTINGVGWMVYSSVCIGRGDICISSTSKGSTHTLDRFSKPFFFFPSTMNVEWWKTKKEQTREKAHKIIRSMETSRRPLACQSLYNFFVWNIYPPPLPPFFFSTKRTPKFALKRGICCCTCVHMQL